MTTIYNPNNPNTQSLTKVDHISFLRSPLTTYHGKGPPPPIIGRLVVAVELSIREI